MSEPMRWRARARGDESGITEVQFASKQNADSWMATMDPARAGTEDEYVLEEIRQPLSEESLALARVAAISVLDELSPGAVVRVWWGKGDYHSSYVWVKGDDGWWLAGSDRGPFYVTEVIYQHQDFEVLYPKQVS